MLDKDVCVIRKSNHATEFVIDGDDNVKKTSNSEYANQDILMTALILELRSMLFPMLHLITDPVEAGTAFVLKLGLVQSEMVLKLLGGILGCN